MESLMKYINHAARCATLYRGNHMGESGLKGCQHAYIFQVCKNPGISQEQLAKNLHVNKSSVTRQLNSLEQNGLIIRRPNDTDKRVINIYPAEKADTLYPQVRDLSRGWNERVLEGFTEEERAALLSMMKRVMEKAAQLAEED